MEGFTLNNNKIAGGFRLTDDHICPNCHQSGMGIAKWNKYEMIYEVKICLACGYRTFKKGEEDEKEL